MWLLTRWLLPVCPSETAPQPSPCRTRFGQAAVRSPRGCLCTLLGHPSICSQGQTQQDSTFLSQQQLLNQLKRGQLGHQLHGHEVWASSWEIEKDRKPQRAASLWGQQGVRCPGQQQRGSRWEWGGSSSQDSAAMFSKSALASVGPLWTQHLQ